MAATVPVVDHSQRNNLPPRSVQLVEIPVPEAVQGDAQARADRLFRVAFGAGESAALSAGSSDYRDSLAKSGKPALGANVAILERAQKVIEIGLKKARAIFHQAMDQWKATGQVSCNQGHDFRGKDYCRKCHMPRLMTPEWETGIARLAKAIDACGEMAVPGTCDNGHEFVKLVQCGRDQCPQCGQRGSNAHMRRFARLLPKIQQMDEIGYSVIQYRQEDRSNKRTLAALRIDRMKIKAVFKQFAEEFPDLMGSRGRSSWDYFGDPRCPQCKRPGHWDGKARQWDCKECGRAFQTQDVRPEDMQWNPHENVLTSSAHIPAEPLTELQRRLSVALVGEFDADIRLSDEQITLPNGEIKIRHKGSVKKLRKGVILHYTYIPRNDPDFIKKALHIARYITKPTFLDLQWDPEMAGKLAVAKFNRMGWWGHWDDEPQWELTETEIKQLDPQDADMLAGLVAVQDLEAGTCPIDKTAMIWTGKVFRATAAMVAAEHWREVGGGYWQRETQPNDTG